MNWDKPVTDGAVPPLGATPKAWQRCTGGGEDARRGNGANDGSRSGVFFFVFFSKGGGDLKVDEWRWGVET